MNPRPPGYGPGELPLLHPAVAPAIGGTWTIQEATPRGRGRYWEKKISERVPETDFLRQVTRIYFNPARILYTIV